MLYNKAYPQGNGRISRGTWVSLAINILAAFGVMAVTGGAIALEPSLLALFLAGKGFI